MIKIALLYQSREGQTVKIATSMLATLICRGYDVSLFDLTGDLSSFDPTEYDAFLLGCSIRYGKHHRLFCRFVERHAEVLNSKTRFLLFR